MAWNILVVDDSSLTRKRIKRIIEMTDLDIGEFLDADNGSNALKVLDESDVDLVLTDLNMPEMSGDEMVHQMKNSDTTKEIPVVVISTESKTSRIKDLLADGVKDYLHKPFTPEEFKEMIQTLWTKSETEAENLLPQALTQALETMAFLTVTPEDEGMIIPTETITAEIGFTGAKKGTIQIIASTDFCKTLAENIAAIDDVSNQAALDALKELSNVTCGLFLPMVVSSTADVFDITVPKAVCCDSSSQWDQFTSDNNSCTLNIEGYCIAIKLTVEKSTLVMQG